MQRMNAREYQEMLRGDKKLQNKYNVSNKMLRTWEGIYKGERRTIVFDSLSEMKYCVGLIVCERSGDITGLELQKMFVLIEGTKTERRLAYIADFYYYSVIRDKWIAGDVKSDWTRKNQVYINKRKLFKQKFPDIEFEEVVL